MSRFNSCIARRLHVWCMDFLLPITNVLGQDFVRVLWLFMTFELSPEEFGCVVLPCRPWRTVRFINVAVDFHVGCSSMNRNTESVKVPKLNCRFSYVVFCVRSRCTIDIDSLEVCADLLIQIAAPQFTTQHRNLYSTSKHMPRHLPSTSNIPTLRPPPPTFPTFTMNIRSPGFLLDIPA